MILGTGRLVLVDRDSARVAGDKKHVFIATDPGLVRPDRQALQPLHDPLGLRHGFALANGTGSAVVKAGGKTWFFLTADYAFGYALQRDVAEVVNARSAARCWAASTIRSTPTTSRRSCCRPRLPRPRSSGSPTPAATPSTRSSRRPEFGIVKGGQKLAGLLVFISDVHSLGLERAQGLNLTEAFYWDLNDKTRAFSKRFAAKRINGKMPTSVQAGFYSAALPYLNAVEGHRTPTTPTQVMAALKEVKWDDPIFGPSYIRADGRKMHNMYLFEVKKPVRVQGTLGLLQARWRRCQARRPSGRWTRANAPWSPRRTRQGVR